ncbi:MAG: CinA family protein [Fibrobacter sp.]|nr:CinA family protein [Fibrobacter sp.]
MLNKLDSFTLAELQNEIQKLASDIKDSLVKRGEMLATAESCTGGLVASHIVDIPGSSAILAGGIVAYQNEIKESLLEVPSGILNTVGAVSAETVKAMAEGARKKFKCEWAVATSGIAGPGGAVPGKPVGTVWMAVANSQKTETFCEIFSGNRTEIREKSVYRVLCKLFFEIITRKSTCTIEH